MFTFPGRVVWLYLALCLLPVAAWGQDGQGLENQSLAGLTVQTPRSVSGQVRTAEGEPVRDANVTITTNSGTTFTSVSTDEIGNFRMDFMLTFTPKEFIATVAVTKKGYPVAHGYASDGGSGKPISILIRMRRPPNDPMVLSEAALVSGLAPKLRSLGPADGLGSKDLKAYQKAADEYLDKKRLDAAVPVMEKLAASNPACVRCRTMLAIADMSWGDWISAQNHLSEAVDAVVANKKLGTAEPLLAYGVWLSWQHRAEEAEPYLLQAVNYAPHDPLALQELGRIQGLTMNWEGAEESLKKALDAGAGPPARLLRAQALVWAGTAQDADAEMNRYLDGRDIKKMPRYVQEIGEKIQDRKKDHAALAKWERKPSAVPYVDYLHHPPPDIQAVEPLGDKVELAAVLSAVGGHVAELFQNFPNTSSLELIHQEKLDHKGKCAGSLNQKFRYLCLIPTSQWGPATNEYRADSTGQEATPRGLADNYMLTSGFVAAALIFHPTYQPGSTFRLLGRQKTEGREAYLVAFAQEPGRSRMYGSFKCDGKTRETFYQGVAWIDAANYQILKLRTELLTPLPVVKLKTEITQIDFNEVHFKSATAGFWLPEKVTVTIDFQGRTLRNQHQYSDFALFNVDSRQRIGKPPGAPVNAAGNDVGKATP